MDAKRAERVGETFLNPVPTTSGGPLLMLEARWLTSLGVAKRLRAMGVPGGMISALNRVESTSVPGRVSRTGCSDGCGWVFSIGLVANGTPDRATKVRTNGPIALVGLWENG